MIGKHSPHITLASLPKAQVEQAVRLLYWLLCYPLCSVAQLALFLGMDASRVYRLLMHLEEQRYVEWVTPSSQGVRACRVYHLSQEGLSLLAQLSPHTRAATLAQQWGTREQDLLRLFPRLPHLLLVENFLQGLVTFAPAIHTHAGQRTRVHWHWQRDYMHHFSYRQREEMCRADAFAIWRVRPQDVDNKALEGGAEEHERWFGAFVLVDAGLISQSLMRERLTSYFHYRESPERWSASYRSFPTVIILTTTWQRAELWRRAHLAVNDRMGLVDPLLAVTTVIDSQSGAAPLNPWQQLPWRTLATGAQCALDQMLVPLDRRALPQDLFEHLHCVQAFQTQSSTLLSTLQKNFPTPDTPNGQLRQQRVLRGNFMARARHFAFQKSAPSPAEMLAYFGLVFGQRYLDILTLLYRAPLLTCEEMADLTDLQPLSVLRYVRELQRFNYLQSRPERVAREIRWYVSEQGLRFLAALHHLHVLRLSTTSALSPEKHMTRAKATPPALVPKGLQLAVHQLQHVKGIYHFLVLLHQQLHAANGHMAWWVLATQCERSFHQAGQVYHLRPDAEFQFTLADGPPSRCWLEWDSGTMQQRGLARKLQAYARYARSREWSREQLMSLPMLLFVVPDKAQEDRVSRILREECADTGLRARTTTRTRLDREGGPLAAIWRNPLLEESEKAHKRSILLPSVRLSG